MAKKKKKPTKKNAESEFWYNKYIEPGIREQVRLLRGVGINTTCSCEDSMTIECETYDECNEINTIYNVLCSEGYERFRVEVVACLHDGEWTKCLTVRFLAADGDYVGYDTRGK